MADREKVIKGLECCRWSRQNVKPEKNRCDECPYKDKGIMAAYTVWRSCTNVLAEDALTLLKEQKTIRVRSEINERERKIVTFQIIDMLSKLNRERIEKYGAVFENGHDFLELMDNILKLLESC